MNTIAGFERRDVAEILFRTDAEVDTARPRDLGELRHHVLEL